MSELGMSVGQLCLAIQACSAPKKGGMSVKDSMTIRNTLKALRASLPQFPQYPNFKKPEEGVELTEEEKTNQDNEFKKYNEDMMAMMDVEVKVPLKSGHYMYVKQCLINNNVFSHTDEKTLDQLSDLGEKFGLSV